MDPTRFPHAPHPSPPPCARSPRAGHVYGGGTTHAPEHAGSPGRKLENPPVIYSEWAKF